MPSTAWEKLYKSFAKETKAAGDFRTMPYTAWEKLYKSFVRQRDEGQ